MYQVSDAYKAAIISPTRESSVEIKITTANATIINLTDSDIIAQTLYVKNQCVNSTEFELGAVYSAECGFAFVSDVDRYSLFGAAVQVTWKLKTGDTWESVPLGVFYIAEANRINNKISVKAYDAMTDFDVTISEATNGAAYTLLNWACMQCGITLGNTQTEIEAMPNGDVNFVCYPEQVATYRDLISYTAIMLGGFAVIGSDGKLYIRQYHAASDTTIPKTSQKKGTSVSDYQTTFRGVVGRFMADENYYPYEKYDPDKTTGLVLDIGDAPLFRGDNDDKYDILQNILDAILTISYTPAGFEILGNPALELGDKVTIGGQDVDTLITSYYWNYRQPETISGAGSNPRLAGVKSGVSRQISQLSSALANSAVTISAYTNAAAITINNTEKSIVSLDFTAAGGIVILTGVVPFEASGDGHIVVKYLYDDELLSGGEVTYYTPKGRGAIPIQAHLSISDGASHVINVKAYTVDETTTMRKIEAVTFHALLDTSEEVVTIPASGMKIAVLGRAAMCSQSNWDGTLTANETTTSQSVRLKSKTFNLADTTSTGNTTPIEQSISETLNEISTKLNTTIPTIAETAAVETNDEE